MWSLDELTKGLVDHLSRSLVEVDMEPGHVKVLASAERLAAVANWVASDASVELSVASGGSVLAADVLLNVRVHGDPDELAQIVEKSVEEIARQSALASNLRALEHFRPGRPVPVHHYATSGD